MVHNINLPDFRDYDKKKPPRNARGRDYSLYDLFWSYYKLGWTKFKGNPPKKNILTEPIINKNAFTPTTAAAFLNPKPAAEYEQSVHDIKSMFEGSPSPAYLELILAFSTLLIRILNTVGYIVLLNQHDDKTESHLKMIDFSYMLAVRLLNVYVRNHIMIAGFKSEKQVTDFKTLTVQKVATDVKTFIKSTCAYDYIHKIDSLHRAAGYENKINTILSLIQTNNIGLQMNYDGIIDIMHEALGASAGQIDLPTKLSHALAFGALPNTNYNKVYEYTQTTLKSDRGHNGRNMVKNSLNKTRRSPRTCNL